MFVNTNNTNVWHKEQIILYCCKQILNNQDIQLNLDVDGPCLSTNGLYDLLDSLCSTFNYEKSRVTIQTANLVESHDQYKIDIIPNTNYQKVFVKELTNYSKDFSKTINYFLNFVGHGNPARLRLASFLFTYHKEKTLQTYHVNIKDVDYSRPYISIEDIMTYLDVSEIEVINAAKFLLSCPLELEPISLPILYPKSLEVLKFYKFGFVDIVNLSFYNGNSFCIDEKILRPMFTKTPFIVQGPQNFITRLKKIGFKTFSNYWDEGYTEDPADYQVNEIFKIIDKIAKYSQNELQQIYTDMESILEHNYHMAIELTPEKLTSVNNNSII